MESSAESQAPEYELWFRVAYLRPIVSGTLTAAVRPGDRRLPCPKGTREGAIALVRIIEVPGDPEECVDPIFLDLHRKVRIDKILVKEIRQLTDEDLVGCAPDSRSAEGVPFHLGLIYNREFEPSETVTVLQFTYL